VRELLWFNRGFMKAETRGDQLVLSDLRMGSEPDYVFRFTVAEKDASGAWHPVRPVPATWTAAANRLAGVWTRLWHEP
jgi:inner membrane protein